MSVLVIPYTIINKYFKISTQYEVVRHMLKCRVFFFIDAIAVTIFPSL
jgi:hypothetical protein